MSVIVSRISEVGVCKVVATIVQMQNLLPVQQIKVVFLSQNKLIDHLNGSCLFVLTVFDSCEPFFSFCQWRG